MADPSEADAAAANGARPHVGDGARTPAGLRTAQTAPIWTEASRSAIIAGYALLSLLLFFVAWYIVPPAAAPQSVAFERALTLTAGLLGVATGWLGGFLTAPYTDEDRRDFGTVAKILATLLTGYVATKLAPMVNDLVYRGAWNNPVLMGRLGVFLTALTATGALMYWHRRLDLAKAAFDAGDAATRDPPVDSVAAVLLRGDGRVQSVHVLGSALSREVGWTAFMPRGAARGAVRGGGPSPGTASGSPSWRWL